MSSFKRRGHYRTNAWGTTFWVREHGVQREEYELTRKNGVSFVNGCQVVPSQCKFCGQKVFYYENEYGSRVFFDQLGTPWPKHRCFQEARSDRSRRNVSSYRETQQQSRSLDLRARELEARVAARAALETDLENQISKLEAAIAKLFERRAAMKADLPSAKMMKRNSRKRKPLPPVVQEYRSLGGQIRGLEEQKQKIEFKLWNMRN